MDQQESLYGLVSRDMSREELQDLAYILDMLFLSELEEVSGLEEWWFHSKTESEQSIAVAFFSTVLGEHMVVS